MVLHPRWEPPPATQAPGAGLLPRNLNKFQSKIDTEATDKMLTWVALFCFHSEMGNTKVSGNLIMMLLLPLRWTLSKYSPVFTQDYHSRYTHLCHAEWLQQRHLQFMLASWAHLQVDNKGFLKQDCLWRQEAGKGSISWMTFLLFHVGSSRGVSSGSPGNDSTRPTFSRLWEICTRFLIHMLSLGHIVNIMVHTEAQLYLDKNPLPIKWLFIYFCFYCISDMILVQLDYPLRT